MSAPKRAARFYREAGVPYWVVLTTVGLWFVVGVGTAVHYHSFDLPAGEANLAGFVAGGFVAAGFYIYWACE